MSSDRFVHALLDDLESQAEGLQLAQRDQAIEDLAVAAYAEVDLASRLHGSPELDLRVGLTGGRELNGRVAGVGEGWFRLDGADAVWLVTTGAVVWIEGLGERAVPPAARGLVTRLSVRACLRRVADAGAPTVLHTGSGSWEGSLGRIGADHLEFRRGSTGPVVVPFAEVLAVGSRR